jgi:hypothetical protein
MPTLQFKEKNMIRNHHLAIPSHTLDKVSGLHYKAEKAKSPDGKTGRKMIIEEDNFS